MAVTQSRVQRQVLLWLSIGVNLSFLLFFKYFNFLSENMLGFLKSLSIIPPQFSLAMNFILPVGISFYTFEAISYIVDVYKKRVLPAQKYWDYVLFIIYFPHLVAGPIMRVKSFLPQVSLPRIVTGEQISQGFWLFSWGLFEKMFIADNLAKIVDPIFSSSSGSDGFKVMIALYAFTFQIFCDFDGYSNMARGLGKLMGFDLLINFNVPYIALSPKDFWQRWHIGLSSWLRDYVYIPLGGNQASNIKIAGNVLVTMCIGGIWHGPSWHFLWWGVYHGALIIVYRYLSGIQRLHQFLQWLIFFHCVVIGWLLFRAGSMKQVATMLSSCVSNFHVTGDGMNALLRLIAFVFPLLIVQAFQARRNDLLFLNKVHWTARVVIFAVMFYLIVGFGVMESEQFIYFQF